MKLLPSVASNAADSVEAHHFPTFYLLAVLQMATPDLRISPHWKTTFCLLLSAFLNVFLAGEVRAGVTPESPEVKKLVDAALKYVETANEERLGGRCLIGLAFLKAGRGDDPNVQLAVDEC